MTKNQIIKYIAELLQNEMPIQSELLTDITYLLKSDFDNGTKINNVISKIGTYCFPFTIILEKIKEIIVVNCSKENKDEVLDSIKIFYSNPILEKVVFNKNGITPDFAMLLGLTKIRILKQRTTLEKLRILKAFTEYIVEEMG